MMFDRYKASFDWAKPGPTQVERDDGPDAAGPAVPFDVQLKRRLMRAEPAIEQAAPRTEPERPAQTTGQTTAGKPAQTCAREPAAPTQPRPPGRDMVALGPWQTLKPAWRGHQAMARKLRNRSDEVKQATDALRTQVLQTLKAKNWRRVAMSAPTSGCGTTFTALNLALSISAIPDVRTLLVDLNQRAPGLAGALDCNPVLSASDLLQGKVSYLEYLRRYGDNLAVGLTGAVPPNPAEILQGAGAAEILDEMTGYLAPDVELFDMPPMLEYDDLAGFLPQVDAVLLVADGTRTQARQIARCERLLEGRAPLLGVVLNRGRVPARKAGIW